jgi:hypothetical protein
VSWRYSTVPPEASGEQIVVELKVCTPNGAVFLNPIDFVLGATDSNGRTVYEVAESVSPRLQPYGPCGRANVSFGVPSHNPPVFFDLVDSLEGFAQQWMLGQQNQGAS